MILFEYLEEKAALEIAALQDRRARIADALNAASKALEAVAKKPPTLAEITEFMSFFPGDEAGLKEMLLQRWVKAEKFKLPDMAIDLATALILPKPVSEALQLWRQIRRYKSTDPAKYQTEGGFSPPPVTEAEISGIQERNRRYVRDSEHADALRFLRGVVATLNAKISVAPPRLFEGSPWLEPYLIYETDNPEERGSMLNPYRYRVKESFIFVDTEAHAYRAFDEYPE